MRYETLYRIQKIVVVFGTILSIILLTLAVTAAAYTEPSHTAMEVHNTSVLDIDLEIKCDWLPKEKEYHFYEFITVPSHGRKTFKLPKDVSKCEVWPQ
jgi:hypothetical protein